MGGSPSPDSSPQASSEASGPADGSGLYEKWLVRILLTLAFGLAFGIEGMTLVRSFLLPDEGPEPSTQAQRPVLREGDILVPTLAPDVRARQMRVHAGDRQWTFTLIIRPDSLPGHPYTLTFDRLTTSNGTALTTAPSHTWPPADTVAFAASWALPVGQRPDALTVTATVQVSPDSTVSTSRTMDVGHVPVRMQ